MAEEQSLEDKAKNHKNISWTADHHTYLKVLYGLDYATDIYEFVKRAAGSDPKDVNTLAFAPVFEARCKGTDAIMRKYIEEYGIRQILSVASGMEQRGIALASEYPDMVYVESDISDIFPQKSRLADSIFSKYNLKNRQGLHFEIADAMDEDKINAIASSHFSPEKKILIVNEGLMAYYSENENGKFADINGRLLNKFGGYWVTSDLSLNREDRAKMLEHILNFEQVKAKAAKGTGRHFDKNGFENSGHAGAFVSDKGFDFTKYGQDELGYTINSFGKIGMDSRDEEILAGKIRDYMKVWVMKLK